jgi:hypothetical protein
LTDKDRVLDALKAGPLSDYGIYHVARAKQHKMTPSSARSRRKELVDAGLVTDSGMREKSSTGRSAKVWVLASV